MPSTACPIWAAVRDRHTKKSGEWMECLKKPVVRSSSSDCRLRKEPGGANETHGLIEPGLESRLRIIPDMNEPDSRESISARPESRFAVVTGVIGGLAAAAISVKGILGSASSTAAIGFLLVPFLAAAAMALAGVWGLALGTVWYALRGAKQTYRAVLLMAWVVALSIPGVVGWKVWEGFALERAVAATRAMSAAQKTKPREVVAGLLHTPLTWLQC